METGGIFVGEYSEEGDCALVAAVSGAPADSRAGRAWFYRGVRGLQVWLDRLWHRERKYFLGEWHFHPYAEPTPSGTDKRQLTEIAKASSYHCQEPILVIIGGDPKGEWRIRSFVFPRDHAFVELFLDTQEREAGLPN